MTSRRAAALTIALLSTACALPAAAAPAPPAAAVEAAPAGFSGLVSRVQPAVVSIKVSSAGKPKAQVPELPEGHPLREFFEQYRTKNSGSEPTRGEGAGFFVSEDGYAVTNNHVVDGADEVRVWTSDGEEFTAKVVGVDARTDLAVVKVDAKRRFAFVPFAKEPPLVGDWVVAVGNPFGLGGSVTLGIVSALNRDIGAGPYDDFMQVDASINKGNSGGPAFNLQGEVVGVNTAIYSPSGGSVGIGFSIPSGVVQRVTAALRDAGTVKRGWLGVGIAEVTKAGAEALGLPVAEGALVEGAKEDSPGAKAGLKEGDVILDLDGTRLRTYRDLPKRVSAMAPGSKASLTVWTDGAKRKVEVDLAELPVENVPKNAYPELVRPLGFSLLAREGSPGVVVMSVEQRSGAEEAGVSPGDVILKAGGKEVVQPADVVAAADAATKAGRHGVILRIDSAGNESLVGVAAGPKGMN